MRLIQEKYDEPWKILTACVLLNKTDHSQVEPVLDLLFEKYPDAQSMASANERDLEIMIQGLGLLSRARTLKNLAIGMISETPLDSIKGIGEYAIQAHQMLVLGDRDFWPRDRKLCMRMIELRMKPKVYMNHRSEIFLKLIRNGSKVYGMAIGNEQTKDFCSVKILDFDKYYKPVSCDVLSTIKTWLKNQKYTPFTERAKEIAMLLIAIYEGKVIGKFESMDTACEVCPAGTEVTEIPKDLDEMSIPALVEMYRVIVGDEKAVAKFQDKPTAIKRVTKAAEDFVLGQPAEKTKPEKAPKVPKDPSAKTDREIMREFLTVGKEFVVGDIATLLGTSSANASTGIQLLRTRPGKNHHALVTEKTEDGKHRVVVAPTAIEAGDAE